MPIVDGVKWACDNCIRGHRVSHCTHDERPLNQVAKKGRPVTQCTECRKKRKEKKTRTKCQCGKMTVRCPHVAQPGEHLENHENYCCCNHGEECTCCAKASGLDLNKIPAPVPEDASESSDFVNLPGDSNMTSDMDMDVTPDTWAEMGSEPLPASVANESAASLVKSRAAIKPRPRPARAPPRSNTIHSSDPARQMQAGVNARQQRAPQRGGTRRNMRRTNSTPGISGFPMGLNALATSEGFNFDAAQVDVNSSYSYGWDQVSPPGTWDQANMFGAGPSSSHQQQPSMVTGYPGAANTNAGTTPGSFDQWREQQSVAQSGAASPTMDDARSVVSNSIDHALAAHTNPFSQQWAEHTQAFQDGFGSLNLAGSTQPSSLLPSVEPSPMLGALRTPSTPPLLTLASGVDTGFNTPSSEMNSALAMTGTYEGMVMPADEWNVYDNQAYDASNDAQLMTQSFNDDYSVRTEQTAPSKMSSSYQTEPQSVSGSTTTADSADPNVPQLTNSALTSGNVSEAEGEFDGLTPEGWSHVYNGPTLGEVNVSLKDEPVLHSGSVPTEYTDPADTTWDDTWIYATT